MAVSTNGQICFGVMFEEGFQFPWGGDEHNRWRDDEHKWWRDVKGYKPPFEIYDGKGNYLNGVKPPQAKVEEYHDDRSKWEKANPFPVAIVNYCSGDCRMYILAAKSSVITNRRGYPKEFRPGELVVPQEEAAALLDFIREHIPDAPPDAKPTWYLSSYWG